MKQPDRTVTHAGISVTLVHNWLTNEFGASFSVDERNFWIPGFATGDKALAHAKRIISGEFEPIAKG